MTMMSRVLGLVRDILFARFLGAGDSADAFFLAFKIPNFLRRLFAEGAFSQAFVPVLSEYRERGSLAAVRHLIDHVAGCLGLSLLGLTVLVVIASPVFTAIFGLGFLLQSPEKFALTTDLLRITFPYLLLISLTGLAGAILNSYDQFAVPSITPVFLNIVLIISAAVVSPMLQQPVYALAWGVLIAGAVQLLFQVPFLLRLGLLPHPKVDWQDESVKKVLRLMAPAMFGVSVSQINLLLDSMIATQLPNGSVSWLFFSDRLTELPLGVFGVGIATVILPSLSRQHTRGDDGYSQTMGWALRMVLLIAVPASCALVILAEPLLFTLFQYGEFKADDIYMASYSLKAYALGLIAFMLIKVLASGYYSRQDTKTPVKIGITAMVVNMLLNLLFVVPLHFIWQLGHVGLALATACSAFLNAGLLLRGLLRQGVYQPGPGWRRFGVQLLLANLAMVAALIATMAVLDAFPMLSWWRRTLQVGLLCGAGLLTYSAVLFAVGLRFRHLKVH